MLDNVRLSREAFEKRTSLFDASLCDDEEGLITSTPGLLSC
jgi:hypothetical protein